MTRCRVGGRERTVVGGGFRGSSVQGRTRERPQEADEREAVPRDVLGPRDVPAQEEAVAEDDGAVDAHVVDDDVGGPVRVDACVRRERLLPKQVKMRHDHVARRCRGRCRRC